MKAQGDARVPAVDGACVNRDVMKHVASVTDYELLARLHFAARKQVKRGNLDMARNLYRTALVLTNFEFARTFLLWGLLEQRAGHIHVARTLFNLGTRIHPRNDSLHCACGLMESKLGHSRAAEARRHFMCAFKLNPQRHGPLLNWKRLGLQGGGIADQDVSRENKKDKKSRNEMPGDPEDVLVEFTTALDMNWEDWVPSVATEYRVAISAAVASTPENVRILNASYVQGVVHVLTQYTVRASIAGITYRRARAEEEVPGGVRRSFASIVELELERRNFVGAHLVRKLRSWEAGDVSASDTHTHTSAAAAARQWVTEEARRLRSEAGAGKGWIESGKTVHLLQSVLEQPIYLC